MDHDASSRPLQSSSVSPQQLDAVRAALTTVRPLLPSQPPLRVFIALNTLVAFQHLPFHDAVARARDVLGAEPYLAEERFREYLASGRINDDDLRDALRITHGAAQNESIVDDLLDQHALRWLLLKHALREETLTSLDWLIREQRVTGRLRTDVPSELRARFLERSLSWLAMKLEHGHGSVDCLIGVLVPKSVRVDRARYLSDEIEVEVSAHALGQALRERGPLLAMTALWAACLDMVDTLPRVSPRSRPLPFPLHRDLVREHTGEDVFDRVFPALIRVSAAYVDDGLADRPMPERHLGFYGAVRNLVADGSVLPLRWMEAARRDFGEQRRVDATAAETVARCLARLGVPLDDTTAYLERLVLTLPGWAGMMARLEEHPEDRSDPDARPSLVDFLAVRLTYELAALTNVPAMNEARLRALYSAGRATGAQHATSEERAPRVLAYTLLQVFMLAGVTAPEVRAMSHTASQRLLETLEGFDDLSRRRVFQEAFERHYRVQTLNALAAHRAVAPAGSTARPKLQFVTCFDDREESFRRHIEELEPKCETLGAPGFFGAAIRFRGLDQRTHVALAPVVINPEHQVEELPSAEDALLHQSRLRRRSLIADLSDRTRLGSRSLVRGMLLNMTLGLLAAFPLVLRIASPRTAGRLRTFATRLFLPNPRTELTLHRDDISDGPKRGFMVDERVARVATVFENIGLTRNFARLVVILGHGATTLNNPHASAYDCGACSGRKGGPNARVVARMANDPEVRAGLAEVGIYVPDDTVFVGGEHDTCSEDVRFFDVQRLPPSHSADFESMRVLIRRARARDAHERCRRMVPFSAPSSPSAFEALRHVQGRAEHLAEPRPELSHQANAVAVIGRRALTRGLFLDRRAFLLSYDPSVDTTGAILERALAAAAPVGAGINLQYYFSAVDPERYGAGSKLPHNVVGLIGVMTGHASDLRTGLPRQMVEVHEPLRLLLIVEATPERLLAIAANKPEIRELVVNHWVQLVSVDPEDGALKVFTDKGFEPYVPERVELPVAETSRNFYRGKTGPLPPARIVASPTRAA
ncbi:MAG: hypothetical protein RL385_531 [Pseudomonadota bacterium]